MTLPNGQYQISAIRLIEEFESDFEAAGLTRGCPDFIFTCLTFGAVSLLKCVKPQYAHLNPDRGLLITLARKAADILARSAATPDHLPAIQHSFISRLIDTRSKSAPMSAPTPGFTMIDFEAFGQSIDADLSKTPWPPTGPSATTQIQSATRPHSPSQPIFRDPAVPKPDYTARDDNALEGFDMSVLESDFGWGMGMGMNMGLDDQGANDGFGWLSGIGASGNFFPTTEVGNQGDTGLAQDVSWSVALLIQGQY